MAQSAEKLPALDKRAMNLAQAMQDYRTEIETSQEDRKNQSHPDKPASFCRLKPGGRF